jgi:type I restriction enzyme S subunit
MSHYKPYPSYKGSGIEWIGEVPDGWVVKPFFALVKELNRKNIGLVEANILSLSYGNIIQKPEARNLGLTPESYETYQIVEPGEIVFRFTDLQNDKRSLRSAQVLQRGIITSAYMAVNPHGINSTYFSFLMRSYDLCKVFYTMGGGLRQSLKFEDVKRLTVLIPSPNEQKAIAKAIDRETTRIDTLIAKKTRFIELLKEKRQALITHAVTKGLNPDVPMKDSGVEWIGEVPEHWEIKQLKFIVSCNDEALSDKTPGSTQISYVDISSVSYDKGIESTEGLLFENAPSRARRKAKFGDVIVSTVRTYLKAVASVDEKYSDCVFSTGFAVLRARDEKLHTSFLKWLVLNELFIQAIESHSEGLSYPAINSTALINLKVVVPALKEQVELAEILDRETTRIDTLIAKTQHSIELLKERRSAFITAAVTGQIDLREAM